MQRSDHDALQLELLPAAPLPPAAWAAAAPLGRAAPLVRALCDTPAHHAPLTGELAPRRARARPTSKSEAPFLRRAEFPQATK